MSHGCISEKIASVINNLELEYFDDEIIKFFNLCLNKKKSKYVD
jgi:hypothetical protein